MELYTPVLALALLATGFAVFSVAISAFTGPKRYNRAKLDSYECGIEPTPQPVGGGRIPVNASGGLACFGEAVPAQALAQVCEVTWQLRGQAGDRQVANARVGITANQGLFGHGSSVLLARRTATQAGASSSSSHSWQEARPIRSPDCLATACRSRSVRP